ncbi:hypothetical protein ACFXKI_45395 [Streptomyces mirabilis]|uniref:hypothetical protein n=1 Tax=Streptomyces mirabilis TaxID=68239 RepID=UPI0036CAF015
MNAVPSLHLTNPSGATRSVRGVIARYEAQSGWQAVADVTLTDAVKWILGHRLVPYADGYVPGWDEAHPSGYSGMLWTAPLYAAAALEERHRRRAQENAEEAHWDAMEASKKVKAAAYDRFWARTGIGPGWWWAFETIVQGAMGDDTFFGAPSQKYGDGRPLYQKRGERAQVLAVALPARLGAWARGRRRYPSWSTIWLALSVWHSSHSAT